MILSASRRTDIPAFYMPWLMKRLHEGFVYVPHPFRSNHYRKLILHPDVIECIVFWTKNPLPMLSYLTELTNLGYPYYVQYTLTGYPQTIEKHLPSLDARVQAFQKLSKVLGRKRIVWRYDPILFTDTIDRNYHMQQFSALCQALAPYTDTCVISFLDWYPSISKSLSSFAKETTDEELFCLAKYMSKTAASLGIKLETCAEQLDLSEYHIAHSSCIDQNRIEQLLQTPIKAKKDRNQRTECGCAESIDIGTYHTCLHGCRYCYATSSGSRARQNQQLHDPHAAVLIGSLPPDAVIYEVPMKSLKQLQGSLF